MGARPAIVRQLFGMPIHAINMDEAVAAAQDAIDSRRRLLIGVVNASKIVHMRQDSFLNDAVLSADMILADGMSVVWASRLLGQKLPERVAGIDLMMRLLERGNERGQRVFCLGATDAVLDGVADVLARDYPNVKLVGRQNGYYSEADESEIANRIAASKADMLFVAMTSPKKEVFLSRWAAHMDVPVCHGVGGAFDVVAGKVRRAPRIWQKLGMEWLYRVLQEPGRLWKRYLVTNSKFCAIVLREMAGRVRGKPKIGSGKSTSKAATSPSIETPKTSDPGDAVLRPSVAKTVDELESLGGEWNELVSNSTANSIFNTWEWIASWLQSRRTSRLLTISLRDSAGTLTAIAPFYVTRMRLSGTVNFRCLRFLGDRDSGSEYPDLLIRNGAEQNAVPALAEALRQNRRDWDCLWAPQIAGWTGAMERFSSLAADGRLQLNTRPVDFGSLELPGTYDAYLASLSANQRSNVRRSIRRVEAAGPVEFVQCTSHDQLSELMPALFDLHQQRWESAGLPGSFAEGSTLRRFCQLFAPRALTNGWLRLYAVKIGGTIAAVQYGYAYNGTFYQLQEGYDPAAPEGVGNVLRDRVFRACIEEGLREYDFLGEFSEHKRRWGAQQRFGYDMFCGRRSVKNRLLFTRPVWPTGKYLTEAPTESIATRGQESMNHASPVTAATG